VLFADRLVPLENIIAPRRYDLFFSRQRCGRHRVKVSDRAPGFDRSVTFRAQNHPPSFRARNAPRPGIHNHGMPCDGLLVEHPRQQETRHALSRRDQPGPVVWIPGPRFARPGMTGERVWATKTRACCRDFSQDLESSLITFTQNHPSSFRGGRNAPSPESITTCL